MKVAVAIALVALVALIGFGVFAYHPALPGMNAGQRPAFDPAVVEKGRILAAAGYCAECHTAPGGQPYAGNYPLDSGFGIIYGSNITPDPATGIGTWPPEAFRRALHEGVDREGRHLFPALPYDHFTLMSDEDVDAIYVYLMSEIPPVELATKESTVPFPLNLRFLQAGWKLLFADFGRYRDNPDKSTAWNRGAYLVEGLGHCGACHTPRNNLGAEIDSQRFAGAEIDRWIAPALTADNPSAVPWTAASFTRYLATGVGVYHGIAAGPMAPVVHGGLGELPASDLEAIGIYLGDIVGAPAPDSDPAANPAVRASLEAARPNPEYRASHGEELYASACAACHYNSRQLLASRPDLGINSAVRLNEPTNLIHVILDGVGSREGTRGVVMPAFRYALSDADIAAIAAYLREARAGLEPWRDLEANVANIRSGGSVH